MKAYTQNFETVIKNLNSSIYGLTPSAVKNSKKIYGNNLLTKKKQKSLIKRIIDALFEPMLIILEIAMLITLGVNLGKSLSGMGGDFIECIGIFLSILISVILTVYMEGKSQKAFELLSNISNKVLVKVIRNGETALISQQDLVVGDIVILQAGDKIFADGRLIESTRLFVDESTLTGESNPSEKFHAVTLDINSPLADRVNSVYSGTFVTAGSGKYIVTAVGDNAEIGQIASDLQAQTSVSAPLQEKLNRLGKLVTAFGIISAVFVLILTVARQFSQGTVNFFTLQDAFLSSIILIVASVPEGLPTTVAIALTLNVVKLSSSNALIKKLVAAETVGCVSVICSDKTGTLTENKMKVQGVYPYNNLDSEIIINSAVNSTAHLSKSSGSVGSPTETALLLHLKKLKKDYLKIRQNYKVLNTVPFSSENKYMLSSVNSKRGDITYIKGAPEVILSASTLSASETHQILSKIKEFTSLGKRVIAFAHKSEIAPSLTGFTYDGFIVISDAIRRDVLSSVLECKRAGITVKMLTGDNIETAYSIARELSLVGDKSEVINAYDIDGLSDEKVKKILQKVSVVARSTPKTKLRIVKLLKELGEVVAVTGDGVNDAPAIKHADIGISMGSGSEITKEASDIVLLDDSFSTIVKAISFGRNIYKNFQRFIMFQLSVNFSSVFFIVISLLLGIESPFTTIQILWINIIMDGPPALTLGLENHGDTFMEDKPVKRSDDIVTKKMLFRVLLHAVYICAVLILQLKLDFIGCGTKGMKTVIFSTFILFQLFNAFNARELGSVSVFSTLKSNKPMLLVFGITFLLQVILSQFLGGFFGTVALSIITWIKMIVTAFSIVLLSEIYKFIKRIYNSKKHRKLLIKNKNNA